MSKLSKPGKKTVELAPSRIRREPVRSEEELRLDKVRWHSPEWEVRLAIIGIILFALAINAVTIGISVITS